MAGTRMYLSPEQIAAAGEKIFLDNKVDIYALGLILLELTINIGTTHERMDYFEKVKAKRRLPDGCAIKDKPEGELILKLTEV